jgi:aspartyl-tRNA synthetase
MAFTFMTAHRTHTCGALRADHVGQTVTLAGWIHRRRDHGGVAFIDLRDHYGITQIVCGPTNPNFERLTHLRAESVIGIGGEVISRDPAAINPELATGEIEIRVNTLEIHSEVETELPVPVFGEPDYPEDIRLRYRFLDLRRETLHNTILLRAKMIASIRRAMADSGFTEFQTPILTASSPEGARDFLVPSRLNPGKFYALPQAPQQFKQLIMVAGFDKYFQIAPCFRDEDPRADRSPTDFYQLDMEMSFVDQQDVFDTMEPVIRGVFEEFGGGKKVDKDWIQISYKDSALWYGTDKPDLRNPIKMQDVSEHFKGSGFAIFANLLEQAGTQIRAIPAPTGGSRKFCDRMNAFAQKEGLPGMGYIFWRQAEDGSGLEAAGPLAKNIGPERTEAIRQQLGLESGDAAFFLGGKPAAFERVAGKARMVIGDELGLTQTERFAFAWIVDFPMYELDEATGKIDFGHNPFSMPRGGLEALSGDPLGIVANQYDLACNGYELLSGGIRNHKPEIMFKAFEVAGYPQSEVEERFGGMVNAFRYGAPPHGGCAAGIDRMVMLLAGTANIRDVIMFPMNQNAQDLMMGAPNTASAKQLAELNIRVVGDVKK